MEETQKHNPSPPGPSGPIYKDTDGDAAVAAVAAKRRLAISDAILLARYCPMGLNSHSPVTMMNRSILQIGKWRHMK